MYALGYIYYLTRNWSQPKPLSGTRTRSAETTGIPARFSAALRRAWVAVRRRQVRGSVERTLQRMPDWTLHDIGIPRAEIPEVAAALAHDHVDGDGGPIRRAAAQPATHRRVGTANAAPARKATLEPVGCG